MVSKIRRFCSKEEYEDFILRNALARETRIREYFEDELSSGKEYDEEIFFDDGRIYGIYFIKKDKLFVII